MLSPPLRPLCLVRRLGRGKNESARWTMGRGKRGSEGSEALPTSHRPPRALYFFLLLLFFWGYLAGASEENRVSDTTINA